MFTNQFSTLACQACRGAFEHGSTGDAIGWAIMSMLIIIVPMLAMIGFFIFRIARRQKACADSRYDDPFLTSNKIDDDNTSNSKS